MSLHGYHYLTTCLTTEIDANELEIVEAGGLEPIVAIAVFASDLLDHIWNENGNLHGGM